MWRFWWLPLALIITGQLLTAGVVWHLITRISRLEDKQ